MRKLLIFFLILSALLGGCGNTDTRAELSEILRSSVSAGEILIEMDTHGGFHGDGETYVVLEFPDGDSFQVPESGFWHELPLSDNLNTFLYEYTHHTQVWDAMGEELLPELEEGYYFFLDRNSDSLFQSDDAELLSRGAYNFILALYDPASLTLYYYELDT